MVEFPLREGYSIVLLRFQPDLILVLQQIYHFVLHEPRIKHFLFQMQEIEDKYQGILDRTVNLTSPFPLNKYKSWESRARLQECNADTGMEFELENVQLLFHIHHNIESSTHIRYRSQLPIQSRLLSPIAKNLEEMKNVLGTPDLIDSSHCIGCRQELSRDAKFVLCEACQTLLLQ